MKNRNNPALTFQGKVKEKGKRDGKSEWTSQGNVNTVSFSEGNNFTAKRRKSGIDTVRSVQIKVANSLVSGETRVELDIHADTIVLGKECMEIYNWNILVKL